MRWIGKILCKLGLHKWEIVEKTYIGDWGTYFKINQVRCKRCNKLKK